MYRNLQETRKFKSIMTLKYCVHREYEFKRIKFGKLQRKAMIVKSLNSKIKWRSFLKFNNNQTRKWMAVKYLRVIADHIGKFSSLYVFQIQIWECGQTKINPMLLFLNSLNNNHLCYCREIQEKWETNHTYFGTTLLLKFTGSKLKMK